MLVLMTLLALFNNSGAQPETFGLMPVDSVVGPPMEVPWGGDDGGGYATSDMTSTKGWRPCAYSEAILREIFGPPKQLSPEFRGWAFAMQEWPEFGVMLVPMGNGGVWPVSWDWGYPVSGERFDAKLHAKFAYSAWLNALTALHRDIEQHTER